MKNPPEQQPQPFFKILTSEDGSTATILLYGYIGRWYDLNEDGDFVNVGVTDVEFVKELERLEKTYSDIHIRINSPGGDVFHGNAICSAILRSTAQIHTYVDGVAASMAADIWLCGKRRHMAKNGMLMIHNALAWCVGNAKDMRNTADFLDKISRAICIGTAEGIGMSVDDMWDKYYADYTDHWLNYEDAAADGLVTETDDEYQAAEPPKDINKMTYAELIKHFTQESDPEGPGLLAQVRGAFQRSVQRIGRLGSKFFHQPNSADMNLDEFKKALADGTLKTEDVQAALNELNPPADPPPAAPTAPPAESEVEKLTKLVGKLSEDIAALKAAPGAAPSQPASPATDLPTEGDNAGRKQLDDFNAGLKAAAEKDDTVRFRPGN